MCFVMWFLYVLETRGSRTLLVVVVVVVVVVFVLFCSRTLVFEDASMYSCYIVE